MGLAARLAACGYCLMLPIATLSFYLYNPYLEGDRVMMPLDL
jgi:hypothetical protein